MGTIYLCIVIFLLCLAVFDLFVGVSNDAVNFLQSAIGAKVAKFRTVLIIASCGVVLGAIMSSGMMDIARHGIMSPDHFTFEEVMTLFLAVMVTWQLFARAGHHQPQREHSLRGHHRQIPGAQPYPHLR